ncbi:hypothetical protein C8R42DRAFT_7307 [Lentinula raphanica]|nr:hypothetical protein C8R42DRAFT_7307 [Lentinula raphanica]
MQVGADSAERTLNDTWARSRNFSQAGDQCKWACSFCLYRPSCSFQSIHLSPRLPYLRPRIIMAPHFLCCLPIRLGAFFVALIELVISGIVAALMWTALYLNSQDKLSPSLSSSQKIASIIFGVTYTILFVASAFGLIGVLRKKDCDHCEYHHILRRQQGLWFLCYNGQ